MHRLPPTSASMHTILDQALALHASKAGALLPILHHIQDHLGYIPDELIGTLSQHIQRSTAEIYGVIHFYTHFRTQAPAAITIELCQAEACQARGVQALTAQLHEQLGYELNAPPKNGVQVKPVYCVGLCAQGPAALVNNHPVAHLAVDTIQSLLTDSKGNA